MTSRIRQLTLIGLSIGFALAATGANAASPNAKCLTSQTFTFDPGTTVNAGTPVTMTQEVKTTTAGSGTQECGLTVGSYVNDGNAKISQVMLGSEGAACDAQGKSFCTVGTSINPDNSCSTNDDCSDGAGICTPVTTTDRAHENPSDGQQSYGPVDTSTLGGQTLGFLATYQGSGNFTGAASICEDLVVNEVDPCSGLTINIDRVDGTGTPEAGSTNNWTFRVTVHACDAANGVTAQGGTNGWAMLVNRSETSLHPSGTTTAEIRKPNKKTDVILWTIGDMIAGQTETLDVDLSGSIPNRTPDCQERFLSGPWSALFSTDGGATFDKTDYTGRVSVFVDSNGEPNDCSAP